LIKLSPLLDLTDTIQKLSGVKKVFVVAVKNECKELLFLLGQGSENNPEIETIDWRSEHEVMRFVFDFKTEASARIDFAAPLKYLYEPNAAILKAGGFKSIGEAYDLIKLHPNSHLYSSKDMLHAFPGRIFEIIENLPYHPRELMRVLADTKANITVRNFPESVNKIRKKTGLKEGGEVFLFATTIFNSGPRILVCRKALA